MRDYAGDIIVYRFAVRGPVDDAVQKALRIGHDQRNLLVEIERACDAARAAAWEEVPEVAAVLADEAIAREQSETAGKALAAARQRAGRARKRGDSAEVAAMGVEVDARKAEYDAARQALAAARRALREVKKARWPDAKRAIARANEERDAAIRATYASFRDAGGYHASWTDIKNHHVQARNRVAAQRAAGHPAQMRYKRWDRTGTVTVHLKREHGVSQQARQTVAALKAAGKTAREIETATGIPARIVALMKADGPERPGDPPCSPAALASEDGKWARVLRLSPELPADYSELTRGQRRRTARQGTVAIRTGAAAHAVISEMPVTIHRPIRADADVKMARLTVTRTGPDLEQYLSLTARVPSPVARNSGRVVAVHLGWRVLNDGSLRVAACKGAGPVPGHILATGVVQVHGDWQEIVFPAAWRNEDARIAAATSRRAAAMNHARDSAAEWIADHPTDLLPSAGDVRQWRSAGWLAVLARECADGIRGEDARNLGVLLGPWAAEDHRAWRNICRARRRLTRRREDAFGQVAAWLCSDAARIRIDEWAITTWSRRPGRGEDDDPQTAAARVNLRLAAPGSLRSRILLTAGREGVAVDQSGHDGQPVPDGRVHYGCGAPLNQAERRRRAVVTCGRGHTVDQDENMLRVMLSR